MSRFLISVLAVVAAAAFAELPGPVAGAKRPIHKTHTGDVRLPADERKTTSGRFATFAKVRLCPI